MLSAYQKEQRKKSLGASDMAAILGISPYKSAYDVWLEKTDKLPPEQEINNDAIEAGNRFERGVLSWAQQSLGPLRRNVYLKADSLPIHAILDARVVKDGTPVEAKTAGLFSPLSGEWGMEHTDQIPDAYLVQVQVQMLCSGKDMAFLAAFLGGRGFQMYDIPINVDLQDIIKVKAVEFWDKHVVADVPPVDSLPSLDLISKMNRTPGKQVSVADELIQEWLSAKEALKQSEDRQAILKAQIYAALGDAEASEPTKLGQITCLLQAAPGSKLDEKRLKAERPEIYDMFRKPESQIRVLRYKKGREE
jgi:putative phage-type endonuclease